MKNFCVIGNSHIAALRLGWESIRSEFTDVQLYFFGAPGPRMTSLAAAEGKLEPTNDIQRSYFRQTSGGRDSIRGDYDAYLFHALQFGIPSLHGLLNKERPENHKRDHRRPISDACFLECVLGIMRGTVAAQMIAELRKITDAPVTVTPTPMPSENATNTTLAYVDRIGGAGIVDNAFHVAVEKLAGEFDFRFLAQPADTLAGPLKTKNLYSRDSVRLAAGLEKSHPKDDYRHMNAAFGALLLRQWFVSGP